MSGGLADLAGRTYGPFHLRSNVDRIDEFINATGDDPARWELHAPPGFAAVILFTSAPAFFADPDAAPYAKTLVHVDQTFEWPRPLPQEEDLTVTGAVESVRHRGEMFFVTFTTRAADGEDHAVLEAKSTFLMTEGALPREKVAVEDEPSFDASGENQKPEVEQLPGVGDELTGLLKSASRADLVRYAGTTRDFNPIHWDHDAAVEAGLPGVIVHGLLMASWVTQAASRYVPGPRPLADLRLRFRQALRPGGQAEVVGEVKGPQALSLGIRSDETVVVSADATLAEG